MIMKNEKITIGHTQQALQLICIVQEIAIL